MEQFTVAIPAKIHTDLKVLCARRGYKIKEFVEKALVRAMETENAKGQKRHNA